jgi:hypothetical protein
MGSEQEDWRKAVAEPIVAIEGLWDDEMCSYPVLLL